jgi:hypothetical protein
MNITVEKDLKNNRLIFSTENRSMDVRFSVLMSVAVGDKKIGAYVKMMDTVFTEIERIEDDE